MKLKRFLINLILIIFVLIFLFATFKIGQWIYSNIKTKKEYEEIFGNVASNKDTDDFSVDFDKLKETNPDVVAWIHIPEIGIDYPILQATNNSFYLNKDINKETNTCGSIFMDHTNSKDFDDNNTVIFGHNLTAGSMFAPIYDVAKNGTGKDFDITILTPLKKQTYKIFSSYIEKPNVYSIIPKLNDINEYQKFIDSSKSKSSTTYDISPSTDNKMITLSTCDISGRKRAIIHASNTNSTIVPSNLDT